MKRSWDIFCSVVDNYGDIGVCWRLARQLAVEMQQPVRLWVDDLASFQHICPPVDPASDQQSIEAVEIRRWLIPFPDVVPASTVIEGFGVRLPETYLAAMAAMKPPPLWINLEHISAEPWVDDYHGLPSPHPQLPLTKYFFFPGFTAKTGGLLFERDLPAVRSNFQADAKARIEIWRTLGVEIAEGSLIVSLFCYENAALAELIDAWAASVVPVVCIVPQGRALDAVADALDARLEPGMCILQGQLSVVAIEFLDLDRYDRLLWASDVNFVRGEDSFVRAQFAARPLVWQAYVQADDAHLKKLAAFLDRYLAGLDLQTADPWRALNEMWNRQQPGIGREWARFSAAKAAASAHAATWARRIADGGNLATKLAEFRPNRLE